MAQSSFNTRGAIDLSMLAAARKAEAESAAALAAAPPGVIVDVTEATFEAEVIQRSQRVPVIIDLWADWCQPCKALSPVLEKLVAEAAGRLVLVKIDVEAEQRLAAAFQVQSIPAVFLAIGGKVGPFFQGALPEAQIKPMLDEVLKVAAANGLTGAVVGEAAEPQAAPIDPRFERAYEAIEAGDWNAARAAYQEVLNTTPADEDAKAGLAQVALLERTDGIDLVQVAAAPLATDDDRLQAADALMVLGQPTVAFDRLLEGVIASSGEVRNRFRDRLLELFLVLGDSSEVHEARRKLTNALF